MLVVPVSGKIGLRNPPVVTLALLVVNCLVFFLLQVSDDESRMAAEQFYLTSGLAAIEVPRYIDYLKSTGKTADSPAESEGMDEQELMAAHFEMEADFDFISRLMDGQVILPQNPEYENWLALRRDYEEKRDKSVAFAYGLRPAYPRAATFFPTCSCMVAWGIWWATWCSCGSLDACWRSDRAGCSLRSCI